MNKLLAALCASSFALALSSSALADDQTPSEYTPSMQATLKQEASAKKAAMGNMTSEERTAARKTRDTRAQKEQDMIIKITQNPWESRNMGINKSAAASKAGRTPPRGTINTPEAEKLLLKQKGQ